MSSLHANPVAAKPQQAKLRKKFLRQNRDLAKSNNIRALRIRELENECACMLSENLGLRGRILELEKQVEDNDARRIADHALAIKDKLESQLTEWGTLLAGLGLEPPMKKHSPRVRKSVRPRMSFTAGRPSPSQRRLREVARDVEELGHISEAKSYPRRSMNHEQILAMQSEAEEFNTTDSPELGPPPKSQFIDRDPVKIDSPTRVIPVKTQEASPIRKVECQPTTSAHSPKADERLAEPVHSPEKKIEPIIPQGLRQQANEADALPPIKAGSKRKFAARADAEIAPVQKTNDENRPFRTAPEKQSVREKTGGKTLKELANIRKEARDKPSTDNTARRPLASKSTNDDISSPKKSKLSTDEVAAAKTDLVKSKASKERSRLKSKTPAPVKIEAIAIPDLPPPTTVELTVPVAEPALLSPNSPDPAPDAGGHRGDTPPPFDISSKGEMSRPSRRNRTAVSYAEPNLRDKMRRPTKELFDAVAGEGKYSRRSSQAEPPDKVKRESDVNGSWRQVPGEGEQAAEDAPAAMPESPLANKTSSPQELPASVATERRRRPSSLAAKTIGGPDEAAGSLSDKPREADSNPDTSGSGDTDIYEFTSSSPQVEKEEEPAGTKRSSRRQTTSTRRASSAADGDKSRSASRRRSMMV
ncbi:shugoshin [Purpureocillium lavendulum]|uniref:Shugoshin n=1 Tax=Purpureocillium lavendulum TaxID=1247861 RepID=A0AB34FLH0_9HYPO|nr:shugoshin [Purpureocillium lavendulum]